MTQEERASLIYSRVKSARRARGAETGTWEISEAELVQLLIERDTAKGIRPDPPHDFKGPHMEGKP